MTCRTAINQTPDLRHLPTFNPRGVTLQADEAWCPRCERVVTTAEIVAAARCEGKGSAG